MPGAGKTTLVKELSSKLQLKGIDTDNLIEQAYLKQTNKKRTISDIFRELNTLDFRNLERLVLHKIPTAPCLVSCGGGLPCFFDNINILKKNGTVIWLNTTLEEIEANAKLNAIDRPTLNTDNPFELNSQLIKLLETRKVFYEKAHFTGNYKECYEFIVKS